MKLGFDWIFFAIVGIPWILGFIVYFEERRHRPAFERAPTTTRRL